MPTELGDSRDVNDDTEETGGLSIKHQGRAGRQFSWEPKGDWEKYQGPSLGRTPKLITSSLAIYLLPSSI